VNQNPLPETPADSPLSAQDTAIDPQAPAKPVRKRRTTAVKTDEPSASAKPVRRTKKVIAQEAADQAVQIESAQIASAPEFSVADVNFPKVENLDSGGHDEQSMFESATEPSQAQAKPNGANARGRHPPRKPRPAPLPPEEDPLPQFELAAPIGRDAANPNRRPPRHAQRGRRNDDDSSKLHKILADAGLGSRRDMEEIILQGRVSVNGVPAHVGQRLGPRDLVRVNGKPIKRRPVHLPARVVLYHKPAGEMVTREDPAHRPLVFDRLPRVQGARWVAVGRLDFNTEGLLIFTTSGDLANKLMHPRFGWEREYAVRLLGRIDDEAREKLLTGVQLDDGPALFSVVEELGGEGANCWYKVVIAEGRNREVRRMFESIGLTVSRLCRVRFGPVALPSALRRGRWAELDEHEIKLLQQAVREVGAGSDTADIASDDADLAAGSEGAQPTEPKVGEPRSGRGRGNDNRRGNPRQGHRRDHQRADGNQRRGPNNPQRSFSEALPLEPHMQQFNEDHVNEDDPLEYQPPAAYIAALDAKQRQPGISDDDHWQPRSSTAHLEGITRQVRKQVRAERGQPGAVPGVGASKRRRSGPPGRKQAPRVFTGPMDTRADPAAGGLPGQPNGNRNRRPNRPGGTAPNATAPNSRGGRGRSGGGRRPGPPRGPKVADGGSGNSGGDDL
jgi:pseudouridine synthase